MSQKPLEVLIIGGGIGGLCLAQGLHKAHVSVRVFERDESAISRTQGFRVHLSPMGNQALHDCLTPDLYELFLSTCGEFGQGFSLMTEGLTELMSVMEPSNGNEDPINTHRSVSRITLRRILLAGIQSRVHFGKRFATFAVLPGGRIAAHFEDGTEAQGDVLIGADGVNSMVRKQFLPDAGPIDTGVAAVGGRIPLTPAVLSLMPVQLLAGPMIIMPRQPISLFMAAWKRDTESQQRLNATLPDTASALSDEGDEDYLVLGFGARREFLGLNGKADTLSGAALHRTLRRTARDWHPNLRKLIEMLDPAQLNLNTIRTSESVSPWPTTNTTLLGDAIHTMTPYRGIGANVALKDANLLCSKLAAVHRGECDLIEGIHQYETAMLDYAFKAVQDSRDMMNRSIGERGFGFAVAKMVMRTINAIGPVKQRLMMGAADA